MASRHRDAIISFQVRSSSRPTVVSEALSSNHSVQARHRVPVKTFFAHSLRVTAAIDTLSISAYNFLYQIHTTVCPRGAMQYCEALSKIVIDNATNAVVIASLELLRIAGISISGSPTLEHTCRRHH